MPGTNNLNNLGDEQFERLCQALLKKVIGNGTITFGKGRDGAREATFSGKAPYPSAATSWDGEWIFQAKFHDTEQLGVDKARQALVADVKKELEVITKKYRHPCDNYIIMTNVPLTSVPKSGTHAKVDDVFAGYRHKIRNLAIWGADDIDALLNSHLDVRTRFLSFLVAGDLIAKLLKRHADQDDELGKTIQAYIQTSFAREQNAQLDQAGDVADDPVRLPQVFFDLVAKPIGSESIQALDRAEANVALAGQNPKTYQIVRLLLTDVVNRCVIVGGPGEGKSTVGQYLAQLHRATLLNQSGVAIEPSYLPYKPRIPFRVVLKDYGQWLASKISEDAAAGTLDEYLCDHVKTLTSRTIDPIMLHQVISENPTLLILDGLDEVTDVKLKGILLERVVEFTKRCTDIHRGDVQILATTRPTGYAKQFDPEKYDHFSLEKLEPTQVMAYVKRWVKAKKLDPQKAERVVQGIKECINDQHVRLMATTPLQVTILAVIVSLGGSPPRQREALFNEYLEVIYKRETAKGKQIIQTSKELLIGLHKYIGYILHEEATAPAATSAYLTTRAYEETVVRYLKFQNPFAPAEVIDAEQHALTRDTGDRLVLIVEAVGDNWGFELRSIQEFFAACHLLDTSKSTTQRFERFEAICRLPHWRNVALFFAGRVGRNFEGEIYQLIEVCKAVDREGPDRFVMRGSELALEMAADRPFGSNERGQRALIEYGLTLIESSLSRSRRTDVREVLSRLPAEDIELHVAPLLRQKIDLLHPNRLEHIAHTALFIGLADLTRLAVKRMAVSDESVAACARTMLALGPDSIPGDLSIGSILSRLSDEQRKSIFDGRGTWLARTHLLHRANDGGFDRASLAALINSVCLMAYDTPNSSHNQYQKLPLMSWAQDSMYWPLLASSVLMITHGGRKNRSKQYIDTALEVVHNLEKDGALPTKVIEGTFSEIVADNGHPLPEFAPLWMVHLLFGNCSLKSLTSFASYYKAASSRYEIRHFFARHDIQLTNPVARQITSAINCGVSLSEAEIDELVQYGGASGSRSWAEQKANFARGWIERVEQRPIESRQVFSQHLKEVIRTANLTLPAALRGDLVKDALVNRFENHYLRDFDRQERLSYRPKGMGEIDRLLFEASRPEPLAPANRKNVVLRWYLEDSPPNSPEILCSILPWVLSTPKVSDEELHEALGIVAKIDPLQDSWEVSAPLDNPSLQRLLKIVDASDNVDVQLGAMKLVNNYANTYFSRRRRATNPRFHGFAEMHRRLLTSSDPVKRSAGMHLLLVRNPNSRLDYEALGQLIQTSWDPVLESILMIAANHSIIKYESFLAWSKLYTDCLERDIEPDAHAVITGELRRILGYVDESLADIQDVLGLPLQVH